MRNDKLLANVIHDFGGDNGAFGTKHKEDKIFAIKAHPVFPMMDINANFLAIFPDHGIVLALPFLNFAANAIQSLPCRTQFLEKENFLSNAKTQYIMLSHWSKSLFTI